jgi:hypothetical protein
MISLLHQTQNCRSRSAPPPEGHSLQGLPERLAALSAAVLSAIALLGLTACSYLSVPVLRSRAADPPPLESSTPDGTGTDRADRTAECAQLRSEIRANQQAVREAPTISTSPEIVAAAEAKADKRIDDTRSQLDELDCPPEPYSGEKLRPLAPLPPAPGMPSAPGAASP